MANLSWLRRHAMELNAQKQFMAASSSGGMGGMGGGERAQAVQVQAYQVPHPSVLPCLPGLLAWPAVHPCCLAWRGRCAVLWGWLFACMRCAAGGAQLAVAGQWAEPACLTADTHTDACVFAPAACSSLQDDAAIEGDATAVAAVPDSQGPPKN
jgi:hypothetical protein